MTNCSSYQELISRLIDDELDENERAALSDHVRRCPNCAAVYVAFRSLSKSLSSDLIEPPASLQHSIMSEVRQSRIRGFSLRRIPAHRRWSALLATAACLILVVGLGLSLPRLRMDAVQQEASFSTANDAAPQEPAYEEKSAQSQRLPMAAPDSAEAKSEEHSLFDAAAESSPGIACLDAARSEALRALLSREPVWLSEAPGDTLSLVYLDAEGEQQTLTVLIFGEEACYVAADGDKYYRIEGGAQALQTLLDPMP